MNEGGSHCVNDIRNIRYQVCSHWVTASSGPLSHLNAISTRMHCEKAPAVGYLHGSSTLSALPTTIVIFYPRAAFGKAPATLLGSEQGRPRLCSVISIIGARFNHP